MKLTTAIRNTRAQDLVAAAGTNPKLKYYTGTEALAPAGTLLATLNIVGALGSTAAGTGVIDLNETVTQGAGGAGSSTFTAGTPTFILVTTSADVAVATLLIGTDVTQTGTVQVGVDITITPGATITEGNV